MNLTWDQYFMAIALTTAMKSKDNSTQVGALIVAPDNTIISTGYNGPPRYINDALVPTTRPEKYYYVIHAEANAILTAKRDLKGCTLYCTLFPCHDCTKMIIQSGITTIKYLTDLKSKDWQESKAITKNLVKLSNIELIQLSIDIELITTLNSFVRGRK